MGQVSIYVKDAPINGKKTGRSRFLVDSGLSWRYADSRTTASLLTAIELMEKPIFDGMATVSVDSGSYDVHLSEQELLHAIGYVQGRIRD